MINIYVDTTGSMTEMGKDSAVLYIAKSIQDYCDFKCIENYFYKLDGTRIKYLPSMQFSNDIRMNISNVIENSILISDGLFDSEDKETFDVAISVGIDADLLNLKRISKKMFDNDSVISALEYLIFHNNLLETTLKESEEDNNEW
jgi:hypothetical protein